MVSPQDQAPMPSLVTATPDPPSFRTRAMALQVAGGVACRCPPALPGGGGRRARGRTPRAVASGAAAAVEEGEGKVRLDGMCCACGSAAVPRRSRKHV